MSNETINLPRLISLVANGAGVDPALVRRFFHELFSRIEEALVAGETVEVKGIGEFARGIDPENPVLFRADPQLAEIANEPFSIFTAVEINDGAEAEISAVGVAGDDPALSPSAADAQAEEAEVTIPAIAPDSRPTPLDDIRSDEPVEAPEPAETPEPVEAPKPAETLEPKETPEPVEVPAPVETPEPTEAPKPEMEFRVDQVPLTEPAPTPSAAYYEERHYGSRPSEYDHHHSHSHRSSRRSQRSDVGGNNIMWLLTGVMFGLIIGLVGGYFAGKTMAKYEFDEEEMSFYSEGDSLSTVEEEDFLTSLSASDIEEHTVADTVVAPSEPQPAETAPKAASAPVYDTVTSNRYLSIIARDHYGSKNYWVFIYEANPGLGNPDKVSAGTRVFIPEKETFMESTKEATDAKAARLNAQIMARYK